MKNKLYDETLGDVIKERLAALEDKPKPPKKVPAKTVIAAFKREARGAMERGYTLEEILQIVKEAGFNVGITTLKTYLRETQRKKAKQTQRQQRQTMEQSAAEEPRQEEGLPATPQGNQREHAGFNEDN